MMTTTYTVNQVDHSHPNNKGSMGNPLWDRQGCHFTFRCCDNRCQQRFLKILPEMTDSDIEVRWMHPNKDHNDTIEQLELYVY